MKSVANIRRCICERAGNPLQVVSVDLFDTLLLRRLEPEPQRFRDIAARWADLKPCRDGDLTASAIFHARWQCAKMAYRAAQPIFSVREATILEILRLQLQALRLPVELLPEVLELELAYEEAALRPNPAVASLCQAARNAGCRVVVASDMYLRAEDLDRLLVRHDLANLIDAIYVSAAIGVTKRSGYLFHHLLRTENAPAGAVLHLGDHYHSDFRIPRLLGIDAHWLPRPLLWRTTLRARDAAFRWRYPQLRLL